MVRVEVQPPSQAQAGAVLYPPLVVSSASDDAYDFIQIALIDPYGRVLEDQLYGTLTMSGRGLDDRSSSRSSRTEYFVFPDLIVSYGGTYSLQISAIRMDYGSPEGAAAIIAESTMTTQIIAYDQSVAAEIPSSDEQHLLRRLRRNGGFGVPRAPR
ncbi:uncharacterized protein GGS22DRAFT_31614 [Annulohypoxylon maeteangense]|uniref:uncharacterized protein n=1 Tax=Annulohypoxylon maeteangense TaxID=1927788 RepID=UPI002008164F|nr:uncharacterized protein GGS22DRAFT_31614 [Annulohypoxylon maeteangense]KAI0883498.1 hypothetical protein GGS22DRAFT_31614 [Annulohypoxylon maeteangense]